MRPVGEGILQVWNFALWMILIFESPLAGSYKHSRCNRADRAQFQIEGCYIPSHSDSILFSEASFLMSHDAATGYIHPGDFSKQGLTWPYAKNQVGPISRQLDDGARALDLRPKLLNNGTVIFQHGSFVNVPVALQQVVSEAVSWCGEKHHTDELVLLLPSNFMYECASCDNATEESMTSAMSKVYTALGVTYLHCSDVYSLTMGQVKELSALSSGGYLLALDGQDYHGSFCGKTNWVENSLVTCWGGSTANTTTQDSCRTSSAPLEDLIEYVLASANNPASDDSSVLGPPSNLYKYPLNEIQALWQVDTHAAAVGIAHFSSILEDNRQSDVNRQMVDLIYSGSFQTPISIFAVDNIALNGNALLSVLRTSCGQSDEDRCGLNLDPPRIWYFHLPGRQIVRVTLSIYIIWFAYVVWQKIKGNRLLNTWLARFRWRDGDGTMPTLKVGFLA